MYKFNESDYSPGKRNRLKGARCEKLAAQLLEDRGYTVLAKNQRIAGVEIDLVVKNLYGVTIPCEVKAMSNWDYLKGRISLRQKQRLDFVARYFLCHGGEGYFYSVYVALKEGEAKVFNSLDELVYEVSL